ncbi:MAG: efflux RND transporter periplasmic adaptor subunit [Phaeodactylibacter sp.]|nr:efflux RND transporter periplasmic adaptor subunit [Phaeodactylibacter sp.]MCB9293280.1 efflux RND transporter periplasmic adaptor subunit [Lewinellaceae bacterium]
MNKRATRTIALIAIAIVALGFILFQSDILSKEKPEPPEEKPGAGAPARAAMPAVPVEAVRVSPEALRDVITVNGSTAPNEEVAITSEVPGKITKIHFQEGKLTNKGDLLIQLDDEELRAERQRLAVQRNLNEKIAERLEALYKKEGVSLQEYEIAVAEVKKVEAEIALIDAQLEKRVVRAPFAGRLGLRLVSEGSYLAPGTPIVNLVSTNPIKVEFNIPEKYSHLVGQGTRISFRLDGSDRDYPATVIAREPKVDAETRTLRLKAIAPNPDGSILPGSFANVTVDLREYGQALLVPTQAIVPELNAQNVYVYRNGKAEQVEVQTGLRQESLIQVTEGLSPGDTVITTGLLQIRPGAAVTISKLN